MRPDPAPACGDPVSDSAPLGGKAGSGREASGNPSVPPPSPWRSGGREPPHPAVFEPGRNRSACRSSIRLRPSARRNPQDTAASPSR